MAGHVEVRWVSAELASSEQCVISDVPGQSCIAGTAQLPLRDAPATISYSVDTTADWFVSATTIRIESGELVRSILLRRDDRGGWMVDGVSRPDLDRCTSVDLGWTPATNTLPLRVAALAPGESVHTIAAWVRFPELDVVASEQRYTCLGAGRVRYESATFTADLDVSTEQIVTRYDQDLWTAKSYRKSES